MPNQSSTLGSSIDSLNKSDSGGLMIGAQVKATQMDDSLVAGKLIQLSMPQATLTVLTQTGAKPSDIAFSNLRLLTFVHSEAAAKDIHSMDENDTPQEKNKQEFAITYVDGKTFVDSARGVHIDNFGLLLHEPGSNKLISHLFIPFQVIGEYRLGPSGPALNGISPVATHYEKRSIEERKALRDKKATAQLQSQVMQTADQLKHAIDGESAYSTQFSGSVESRRLGNLLLEENMITKEQLGKALLIQKHDPQKKLGEILEEMGAVNSQEVFIALSHKMGIPYVQLRNFDLDVEVLSLIPVDIARKHHLIPLLIYRSRLVIAIDDPTNTHAIDMVRFITGRNLELALADRDEIEWAINRYYIAEDELMATEEMEIHAVKEAEKELELKEAERLSQEKPIVRLVSNIIRDAIRRRASDIHIRPLDHEVDLLFRIDGSLVKLRSFNKDLLPAVVSRIKILGRMNIAERRLPQDGRTRVIDEGNIVDLRISCIPTVSGESIVIRLLNVQVGLKTAADLGFNAHDQEIFIDMIHKSYGLFLVTGPTGSGKSTTLYAALNEVIKQNVNIITVEDPVEYHIEGIEQIQVSSPIGFTFAKALRHILRHDPDVVMIGEIRDQETGKIAVESALTGHLVLSTLHTNNAASAITRLMEMGVEPYLLSSTLLSVLAQRLVRRNCINCLGEEKIEPSIRRVLDVNEDEVFYRGTGCDHCNHTGYSGRLAVYELLQITPTMRSLIVNSVNADEIHLQALKDGMVALTENALNQARQRKTSLAEVYRVRLE